MGAVFGDWQGQRDTGISALPRVDHDIMSGQIIGESANVVQTETIAMVVTETRREPFIENSWQNIGRNASAIVEHANIQSVTHL